MTRMTKNVDDLGWLSVDELLSFGFTDIGVDTQVSRKCSFYEITGSIGRHTRIDDFCVLKGHLEIGAHVHIAAFNMISGVGAPVTIEDGIGIGAGTNIMTQTSNFAANDIVTPEGGSAIIGPVTICIGAGLGVNCVVLPNVQIGAGASIGSACLINKNVPPGAVVRAPKSVTLERTRNWEAIVEEVRKLP